MFVADEGEHTQDVFLFQFRCRVDGCEETVDLWIDVVIPKLSANVLDIEGFWGECGEQTIGIGASIPKVCKDDAVSHLDGAEEQFGRNAESEKGILVFGV